MNIMTVSLTALSLATFGSLPAEAQQGSYRSGAGSAHAPSLVIAQSEPWAPRPGLIVHGARSLRVSARPMPALA